MFQESSAAPLQLNMCRPSLKWFESSRHTRVNVNVKVNVKVNVQICHIKDGIPPAMFLLSRLQCRFFSNCSMVASCQPDLDRGKNSGKAHFLTATPLPRQMRQLDGDVSGSRERSPF